MSKVEFTVSARTVRLIGRENVANAEGAIIELVKNSYDADAKCCIVYFDNKYNSPPIELSKEEFEHFSSENENIKNVYHPNLLGSFSLIEKLEKEIEKNISQFFRSKTSLYIIDNGEGMDNDIIRKRWMHIGTDFKLNDIYTPNGRIRSGAKGIGRFALDRLGDNGEMVTLPNKITQPDNTFKPNISSLGFKWNVDWSDFEKENAIIGKVTADLFEVNNMNFNDEIVNSVDNKRIEEVVNCEFNNGTILKVTNLRDDWNEKNVRRIFNSLEILTPPEGQREFSIHLFSNAQPEDFGKIDNSDFNDYDYKIQASFLNDTEKNIEITIERNEIDWELLDKDLFQEEDMKSYPFDADTIKKSTFTLYRTLYDFFPGYKEELGELAEEKFNMLGQFEFNFYFLKRSISSIDQTKFFQKDISKSRRDNWYKKFGGIRVFRDSFRVRPFGELNSSFYDWLALGERQASSPAAVSRKNQWRTRPYNVAGNVHISRIFNLELQDKSSREGLQENETFNLLREVLLKIIKIFEDDRSTIAYNLDVLETKKNKVKEAIENANRILEEEKKEKEEQLKREKAGKHPNPKKDKTLEQLEKENQDFKTSFEALKKEQEFSVNKEARLQSLASTGILFTSFAHELAAIRNDLDSQIPFLRKYINELNIDLSELIKHKNPLYWAGQIEETDVIIKQWYDFVLNKINRKKHLSKPQSIVSYLNSLTSQWQNLINTNGIVVDFSPNLYDEVFTFSEIEFNSVFDNLIVNSVDAFSRPGFKGEKNININLTDNDNSILIEYKDSGPGLIEAYKKEPYRILEFNESSKINKQGEQEGTGVGMWIVKNTVNEYKGTLKIDTTVEGFKVLIEFPKK
ncbi:sensor histidine kinase [Labilibaculum sp. K2S]|uniref:sensor histidine kinase n=1 Tax=Labilibaculum sp. K2S TaxID=3056386 RepID=UPI0025A481BB|nr:sensor histidine kinase [Labilibaculum sp. K2S]MDM8159062.1 sensor histidine kinase [Labilibaculum sp. K2S]